MAGNAQQRPDPDPRGAAATSPSTPPSDPGALREAVDRALASGDGAGLIYAALVRPSLAVADDRRAIARSAAHAALAGLAAHLLSSEEGLGRRAAVLAPPGDLGELDARALCDALEAGGWTATPVSLEQSAGEAVAAIAALGAELAVVPAADAAQVLSSQATCSALRRVASPPLVVGVAFEPAAGELAAIVADHVVGTVDALAPLLRRRIGAAGGPAAWGVRLYRDDAGLVVAPVGVLDRGSVARLREIVETRRALYPRIVIDLRELVDGGGPGLESLVAWDAEQPWDPDVAALGDPRTIAALSRAGLADALPLAAFDL